MAGSSSGPADLTYYCQVAREWVSFGLLLHKGHLEKKHIVIYPNCAGKTAQLKQILAAISEPAAKPKLKEVFNWLKCQFRILEGFGFLEGQAEFCEGARLPHDNERFPWDTTSCHVRTHSSPPSLCTQRHPMYLGGCIQTSWGIVLSPKFSKPKKLQLHSVYKEREGKAHTTIAPNKLH